MRYYQAGAGLTHKEITMKKYAIEELVETLLNGNLSDAKAKAKRYNHRRLRQAYQEYTGCTDAEAGAAADYLKGLASFQEYCDAQHNNH